MDVTATKTKSKPIPSPLKWHGGKGAFQGKLAKWIVGLMPPHRHYVEPYFGGGSVLLARPPDQDVSEVVNDIHYELTNFWSILRSETLFDRFKFRVDRTPFSEVEFERSKRTIKLQDHGEDVGLAVSFFIQCRQSLAGRMKDFAPLSRTRTRRRMNEQASAWLTTIEGLPEIHERLKKVVILNRDALDVIRQQDGEKTLFYCDPTYPHSSRSTTGEYEHEMSDQDHTALLNALSDIKGNFVLSTYPNDLYHSVATKLNWKWKDFEIVNNASGGKKKSVMTERVYMNY